MKNLAGLGLVVSLLCAAPSAFADEPESAEPGSSAAEPTAKPTEPPKTKAEAEPEKKSDTFGHFFQFGLRAGLVGGYDMIFRYDQSPFCANYDTTKGGTKDQQKFCGHGAPLAMDFAASFALLDSVEPYIWARIGLGHDSITDTHPVRMYGVGARIYTMSDSAFKIFVDPAVAWEVEGGDGRVPGAAITLPDYHPTYKKDLIFHLAAGPQFDFAKYVGVFLDAGLTTGILREIHTTLELQGGVQARFP